MATCPVCTDKFTSMLRKDVTCPKCQYQACLSCYKQYFSTSHAYLCINPDCKEGFSEDMIYNNFPRTYIQNDYKKTLVDKTFEEERSMIPQTMLVMERRNEADEIFKEVEQLNRLVFHKNQRMRWLRESNGESDPKKLESQTFINKCPGNDCLGFLNKQYSCGACKKHYCSKCLEEKEDNHACDPDILATVKLLKKDSKTCPKCSVLIHKIEGCNQMYCTACHTSFDWKTKNIVTKNIHNPHYYEYLRGRGIRERTEGDIPCGGLIEEWRILTKIETYKNLPYQIMTKDYEIIRRRFLNIYQFVADLRYDKLPMYRAADRFKYHLELRIQFIKKILSEKEYRMRIKKFNTDELKKRKTSQLLTTTALLFEDQFRNLLEVDAMKFDTILDECRQIIEYMNTCFETNQQIYHIKFPRFRYYDDSYYNYVSRHNDVIKDGRLRLTFIKPVKKANKKKVPPVHVPLGVRPGPPAPVLDAGREYDLDDSDSDIQ